MSKKNTKSEKGIYLLAIFLSVFFIFSLLIFSFRLVSEFQRGYINEYSVLSKDVQNADYPQLLADLSQNEVYAADTVKDSRQFVLLGKYYQAAMLYHSYVINQEKDEAKEELSYLKELETQIDEEDVLEGLRDLKERYQIP